MLRALEGVLKAVLPPPAKDWASRKRQHARLLLRPRESFDHTNLAPRSSINLTAVFAPDPTWQSEHKNIAADYGEGELLAGVNPGDRRALYHFIRTLKPRRVLETGTHVGASTIHIARALKANGTGSVTTADILDVNSAGGAWRKVGLTMPPRALAHKLGCENIIDFVAMPAQDYMRRTDERFEFVFLDGDHTPAGVYTEVALALRLLAAGGTILLHDYHPTSETIGDGDDIIEGPFLAMKRVHRENSAIEVMPLGTLPWPTKANTNLTSLALVTRAG